MRFTVNNVQRQCHNKDFFETAFDTPAVIIYLFPRIKHNRL